MANNGKKNNKLKRKRGKKFRFYEGQDGQMVKQEISNPFEEHSKSKKDVKDTSKVPSYHLPYLLCIENWTDR
jgi:hypothetical protein